jgi:hypothetical protein
MIRDYSPLYFASVFLPWICFPYLIRFNPWAVLKKTNYEHHQDLLTYRQILLFLQLVALHHFVYVTLLPVLRTPKAHSYQAFTSSGEIPVINQSRLLDMPTVCGTNFASLSVLQYAVLAETVYDSAFGRDALEQKLDLSLGRDWNQALAIVATQKTDFTIFEHFRRLDEVVDVLVIRGTSSKSDMILTFSI